MKTLHWKEKLNNLGKNGTPCFFIIDYKGTNAHNSPF